MSGRFKVAKCGYSRKPWRIIDTHAESHPGSRGHHAEGAEVWVMETIHAQDGPIAVPGPLAFDRKRDAMAAFAKLDKEASMQCGWCSEVATVEREIASAILEPKTKNIKKPAVTAWVCPSHSAMIDREVACREIETAIHRIDLKLRKLLPDDPKHDGLVRQREELRGQLHELQGRVAA